MATYTCTLTGQAIDELAVLASGLIKRPTSHVDCQGEPIAGTLTITVQIGLDVGSMSMSRLSVMWAWVGVISG